MLCQYRTSHGTASYLLSHAGSVPCFGTTGQYEGSHITCVGCYLLSYHMRGQYEGSEITCVDCYSTSDQRSRAWTASVRGITDHVRGLPYCPEPTRTVPGPYCPLLLLTLLAATKPTISTAQRIAQEGTRGHVLPAAAADVVRAKSLVVASPM